MNLDISCIVDFGVGYYVDWFDCCVLFVEVGEVIGMY